MGRRTDEDGALIDSLADLSANEFKPCVVVYDDPKRTEMVLRDCSIVWRDEPGRSDCVDLGYDIATGELVAVRIRGDVSKRK